MSTINSPQIVTVTGRVANPDLTPAYTAIIKFTLEKVGLKDGSIFVRGIEKKAAVSPDGSFTIGLWANQESRIFTPYKVEVIVGSFILNSFRLYLSPSQPNITLSEATRLSNIYESTLTDG